MTYNMNTYYYADDKALIAESDDDTTHLLKFYK